MNIDRTRGRIVPADTMAYDIVSDTEMHCHFPEMYCPDMNTTIRFAVSRLSAVRLILTFVGGEPDTCYVRKAGEWEAYDSCPVQDVTVH